MVVGLVVTAAVSLLHRGDIFTAAAPAGANRSHDAETAAARLCRAHIVLRNIQRDFFVKLQRDFLLSHQGTQAPLEMVFTLP